MGCDISGNMLLQPHSLRSHGSLPRCAGRRRARARIVARALRSDDGVARFGWSVGVAGEGGAGRAATGVAGRLNNVSLSGRTRH